MLHHIILHISYCFISYRFIVFQTIGYSLHVHVRMYTYVYVFILLIHYTILCIYRYILQCSNGLVTSEGAQGMFTRQRKGAYSLGLHTGIAYADAYEGLHTSGFCLPAVLISTLLLNMNKEVLDVAHMNQ